jgi:hypothetical protein
MAKRINERVRKKLLESHQRLEREVFGADGGSRVVYSADASSPSFGKDLEHIFRMNVARARRDNKRILGVADLVPPKRRAADPVDPRRTERLGKKQPIQR